MWAHNKVNPIKGYLDKTNCNTRLLKSVYLNNSIQKSISSLDKGNPVYLATTVSRSMINCDRAINGDSSKTNGGHALAILGYKIDPLVNGGGYFIVQNSWGSECGDKGFQYLSFKHCQRNDTYCLFWEISSVE
jgi:C1A family cysteine protease